MRLKQYVFPGLIALALCAAGLVAWPTPAQAQASSSSTHSARGDADASPARVVVRSGDCLWSISQRLVPADATPQQIYNEVARIYALNRDQIGEDPNLIYAGQVLKVAPASTPVAGAAGSERPGRSAGPALSEKAPKKGTAAETSGETAQRTSRDVSRAAARERSSTPAHQSLPKLAHAPILKPVAELSPKTASDEERWLPEGQLFLAAVVGTVISWGALCLVLAVVFLVARKLPTKSMPIELLRNSGEDQRRTEVASPAPAPTPATLGRLEQDLRQQLRTPLPKPKTRTTKVGGSQW